MTSKIQDIKVMEQLSMWELVLKINITKESIVKLISL